MAQSKAPPPQAQHFQAEQNPDGGAETRTNTRQQTEPLNQIAPIEHQNPVADSKAQSDGEAEKRANDASEYGVFFGRRLKITDFVLTVFTLFLVLVGIGQGFVLYRTDQGTHKAADAAKDSANAARDAVELARKTAERQLRAYVYIDASEIRDFFPGQRMKAALRIKNFGNTPAKTVLAGGNVYFGTGKLPQVQIKKLPGMVPSLGWLEMRVA